MDKNQARQIRENEELWIDYLENELTPSLKEDLDIQFEHSSDAQQIVAEYKHLKSAIKNLDPAQKLKIGNLNDFHSKVMGAVADQPVKPIRFSHTHYQLAAVAAVFLLVLGGLLTWNISQTQDQTVDVATESGWLLETPLDAETEDVHQLSDGTLNLNDENNTSSDDSEVDSKNKTSKMEGENGSTTKSNTEYRN